MGAEHCTDTAADPRPRVCQLAVCTSCRRVTKSWPEISLRLHLVLDSEKEVDLPTELPPPRESGWLSVRPTHTLRRDQLAHTCSCSTRVTRPASLQTYQRADLHRSQFDRLNPLPDPPYLPELSGCVLASECERKSWREISLQEPPAAVSLQVVVIRPSVLSSFASLYLLFLPLSPKVTKNQPPLTSSCWWWLQKCTGLLSLKQACLCCRCGCERESEWKTEWMWESDNELMS